MKRSLRPIIVKSTIAALLSVVASLALAFTLVPALGGVVNGNAWLMCIVCPLVIAWPASAYQFWQTQRLRDAHREIARLHAELARAHEDLLDKASRDGMTGILNRESFFAAMERAMSAAPLGTLLLIDADEFKQVNDRFGHPTGDAALLAISRAIAGAIRERDVSGRIGGEEFAVYLTQVDAAEAVIVAERIRQAVAQLKPTSQDGAAFALSVSIGGAAHHGELVPAELVAQADRQLYMAKHLGRNRTAFATQAVAAA